MTGEMKAWMTGAKDERWVAPMDATDAMMAVR
jgi:hypothetical protein